MAETDAPRDDSGGLANLLRRVKSAQHSADSPEINLHTTCDLEYYDPKDASRRAHQAKQPDTPSRLATRQAKKHLRNLRAGPNVQPDLVAWVESHFDQVVDNFRTAIRAVEPDPTPTPEPTHVDPDILWTILDRVRGRFQP